MTTVEPLKSRRLSLLRQSEDKWGALQDTRQHGRRFSLAFPHDTVRLAARDSLVLISVNGAAQGLRLGLLGSRQTITTLETRVVFDHISEIQPPTLAAMLAEVTDRSLRGPMKILANSTDEFRTVSDKLGERLFEIIAANSQNAPLLKRLGAIIAKPTRFTDGHALQYDAVNLALKMFGVSTGAKILALNKQPTALGAVRLHEDAVIEHDARWIKGWRLVDSDLTGRARFQRDGRGTLEVFTANKRPLERIFGVDLIYFNRPRQALVMVQYKMMERAPQRPSNMKPQEAGPSEPEWVVAIEQFSAECARMAQFDKDLPSDATYRLNASPFFIKLVKRDAAISTAGIIMSLGHLNGLMTAGLTQGPKGGLRIRYGDLNGHYLRGDGFVDLVQSGVIAHPFWAQGCGVGTRMGGIALR